MTAAASTMCASEESEGEREPKDRKSEREGIFGSLALSGEAIISNSATTRRQEPRIRMRNATDDECNFEGAAVTARREGGAAHNVDNGSHANTCRQLQQQQQQQQQIEATIKSSLRFRGVRSRSRSCCRCGLFLFFCLPFLIAFHFVCAFRCHSHYACVHFRPCACSRCCCCCCCCFLFLPFCVAVSLFLHIAVKKQEAWPSEACFLARPHAISRLSHCSLALSLSLSGPRFGNGRLASACV